MDVLTAIATRRSIKRFSERAVTRGEIQILLDAAAGAPNHRLTQPWRFYVLGPQARRAYGTVLGQRKAKRIDDPSVAEQIRSKVAAEHEALPAMIAIAMSLDENPEVREEDYAACMMALQNLCLAATASGLGTHIKTGGVMEDPGARVAVGVPSDQRIVAVVNVGEAQELPAPKERTDASSLTIWVP